MSKAVGSSSSKSSGSSLQSKSPAEFFAEHQHIAGFDNPGKSLYTTIREFVENSLDAAEAIRALPNITVRIEKLAANEFNKLRGVEKHTRADLSLYEKEKSKSKSKKSNSAGTNENSMDGPADAVEEDEKEENMFFRVTCRDNGGGMAHEKIPQMLGIVLSSTKYGVKQTRGKFGLGAKMALVWAMKSTGLPIQVLSATSSQRPMSYCKLYIDIHKNQPDVVAHEQRSNSEGWQGTEISVVIGGKWKTYQSKIVNYMRQLAVITPYAHINMEFIDQESDSKSWSVEFSRRTDVMPPAPLEVKHHPSSVDNLLVEQLIHHSKAGTTLKKFLATSFSSISASHAERLITELKGEFFQEMDVRELDKKQIHQLTALLRAASFQPPDGACLSSAGEYNLRLGIMKELNPELVATASISAEVIEGHPFQVEAAVALGGTKAKPGISVFRYANRIPLLFEGGSDVSWIVANKKIKWSSYRVNSKTDKIAVFVSIVSTKIPFKGTSKEYIGDDKGILHGAIKKAISQCCVQVRKRLVSAAVAREKADRKKQMAKYIPDVSRAIMNVLNTMSDADGAGASMLPPSGVKRARDEESAEELAQRYQERAEKLRIRQHEQQLCESMIRDVLSENVSEEVLEERLFEHVEAKDAEMDVEAGDHDNEATNTFFLAGIDASNSDMKTIYGTDFKIRMW